MSRRVFWAALVVAGAVLVGCGPEKDIPSELPRGTEPSDPSQLRPTTSEPAAKAFVNKALHTYTGGKLEEVARGRHSRLTLKGKMQPPTDQQQRLVDATRTIAAVWPDRFHGVNELQGQGRLEVWLRRPRLHVAFAGQELQDFNAVEMEKLLAADATGQHWMAFFLPLIEPGAVVYELRAQMGISPSGQPLPIQTLKLALSEFPVYDLTFDANTHALLRVEYTLMEAGQPVRRSWTMLDHKVGAAGLLLPSKMECRWGNLLKEEWEVVEWEFPASISADEFTPPRK